MIILLLLALDEHTCKDGYVLKYEFKAPEAPEDGKKYPLALCLHGKGGKSDAAIALARAEMRKKYPCYLLYPKVDTKEYSWAGGRKAALGYVFEALDALLEKHPIDRDRIYVTGQSMGGYGTFGALAARPEFFAAAAPVCGGGNPKDAEKYRKVPIWVFHGADDPTVPVEKSREMVKAIKEAGGDPKFTEYPGVKHNSWEKAYADAEFWKWMFDQARGK
jgi:predicted peptidase